MFVVPVLDTACVLRLHQVWHRGFQFTPALLWSALPQVCKFCSTVCLFSGPPPRPPKYGALWPAHVPNSPFRLLFSWRLPSICVACRHARASRCHTTASHSGGAGGEGGVACSRGLNVASFVRRSQRTHRGTERPVVPAWRPLSLTAAGLPLLRWCPPPGHPPRLTLCDRTGPDGLVGR